jgi:hypothetical protein
VFSLVAGAWPGVDHRGLDVSQAHAPDCRYPRLASLFDNDLAMTIDLSRRRVAGLLVAAPAVLCLATRSALAQGAPVVEVYKSPTCGCCNDWIKHLQANGFTNIKTFDVGNAKKRAEVGMSLRYGSCHTALIDGYVVEGHVPAREIKRLLKERPKALGLSVPGMPLGSPGMEVDDGRVDRYEVMLVQRDETATVFATYERQAPRT